MVHFNGNGAFIGRLQYGRRPPDPPAAPLARGLRLRHLRAMNKPATLRSAAALAEAGLVPADRLAALEEVAARYAVAVTPAMAELIEAADDAIARQFLPDAAELDAAPGETTDPIGDAAPQPGRGDRPPLSRPRPAQDHPHLRRLLPLLLPARDGRAGRAEVPVAGGAGGGPGLCGGTAGDLGADRHRRRSLRAVAPAHRGADAAAGGHRPPQGRALPHPRPGGRSRRRHRRAGAGPEARARQGGLCRPARQPPARDDGGGAGGLRPAGRRWHTDGQPERAAEGRQRRPGKRWRP